MGWLRRQNFFVKIILMTPLACCGVAFFLSLFSPPSSGGTDDSETESSVMVDTADELAAPTERVRPTRTPLPGSGFVEGDKIMLTCDDYYCDAHDDPVFVRNKPARSGVIAQFPDRVIATVLESGITHPDSPRTVVYYRVQIGETEGIISNTSLIIEAAPEGLEEGEIAPLTADSFGDEAVVQVSVSSANLRSGPGVEYDAIGVARLDDVFEVIATNSDGSWYNVQSGDGTRYWIGSSIVEQINESAFEEINPAATIPAAP